jgi:L-ascorbate metabolism protein UlaG (beta-lactamase superfamily)
MSNAITWIGRSTVLVELDSMRLLTDPALRSRVAHLRRAGSLDDAEALRRGVGAVLIFHLHHDHLDLPSLERLGRPVPVVVPRGAGTLLAGTLLSRRRFKRVVEVGAGEVMRSAILPYARRTLSMAGAAALSKRATEARLL